MVGLESNSGVDVMNEKGKIVNWVAEIWRRDKILKEVFVLRERERERRKEEEGGRYNYPNELLMVNPPRHSICQPEISRSIFFKK